MEKLVILGGGESGVGAALLGKVHGWDVFLSDKGKISDQFKKELMDAGIDFEEGQHTLNRILDTQWIVKSPGIPDSIPMLVEASKKGIRIISEIEFGSWYCKAKTIGITGSNGKTTTTTLTYHLLKACGADVVMGGNVGKSFARLLLQPQPEWYVLELSSFQLDGIEQYRPDISMILNITPDHLDRYGYQMDRYIAAKFRIARNQGPDDWFIINQNDQNIQGYLASHPVEARVIQAGTVGSGMEVMGHFFSYENSKLRGPHNYYNGYCAVMVAMLLGLDPGCIQRALDSFQPVPHRLESLGEIGGVEFINDSKATNVDAVFYALQSMNRPTIWIAGGQDKGNDYEPLYSLIDQKVKAIICLGVDNQKILGAFSKLCTTILETDSAAAAVEQAFHLASPGDVVLLSPACASFDLFKNYEDRGNQFKSAFANLKKEVINH